MPVFPPVTQASPSQGFVAQIAPRKNASHWKKSSSGSAQRNEAIRACKRLGRSIWKKWSGYHRHSLVETKMHCFKRLGERMRETMNLDHFAANAGQLFDELNHLKLMSPEALTQVICKDDARSLAEVATEEFKRLKAFLDKSQSTLLEEGSSDVLLVGLLKNRLAKVLANHPMGRGLGRPSRLAQIAVAYRRMGEEA